MAHSGLWEGMTKNCSFRCEHQWKGDHDKLLYSASKKLEKVDTTFIKLTLGKNIIARASVY